MLNFYGMRFQKQKECQPNPAHLAIARLSERHSVVNITQNIDTLLERAGCTDVWHLHCRIDMQKCEEHHSLAFPGSYDSFTGDYRSRIDRPIALGDLCPKCGGQLRPDIVWFSESRWICGRRNWNGWCGTPMFSSEWGHQRRCTPAAEFDLPEHS